jgi:hypothetical protein
MGKVTGFLEYTRETPQRRPMAPDITLSKPRDLVTPTDRAATARERSPRAALALQWMSANG